MYPPEPTDELLGVLHLATELANQLGHAEVTPEHVLMALARTPGTSVALVTAGADLQVLTGDLREYLARTAVPAKRWQLLGPSYALSLRKLLDAVMRNLVAADRKAIGVGDVFDAVLRADAVIARELVDEPGTMGAAYRDGRGVVVHPIERLRQVGFRHVDALMFMAHGNLADAVVSAGGEDDPVVTLLYNDDFTPIEYVHHVLRDHFGMTEARARTTSMAVQVSDCMEIDRGTRAVSVARVQRILEAARAAGHPLLLTVEEG